MCAPAIRIPAIRVAALLAGAAALAAAADQPGVRAALVPAKDRKPAPAFALKDSSSKTAELGAYRGKVVLLDFWATWCHGCKEEIPWFAQFNNAYSDKGLAVIGVSMDDDGWPVLKPFLAKTQIPYRIVLADAATPKQYGIDTMPDTFLIDRHGRLAATYNGMVNKDNVESNIRALLAEK